MRLDVPLLDQLVREYCVYRGIVDSGIASPLSSPILSHCISSYLILIISCSRQFMLNLACGKQPIPEPVKFNKQDPGYCSSRDCSIELDCNAGKHSDGETSVTNAHMDGSPENNADVTSMRGVDVEVRYASEPTCSHEDCSTSGSQQLENPIVLQRSRLPGTGERSKRKRWRGRYDDDSYMHDASLEDHKQEHSMSTVVSTLSKEKQVSV